MKSRKVLITGGAGFIGSHLALKLLSLGYEVSVLDNLSPQIHGEGDNSELFQKIKGKVRFVHGDVQHKKDWEEALKEQEIVVHLAAETGTGQSMYQIEKYSDVNVKGTSIFLDILTNTKHTIKKVVLASSRAVYGEGKYYSPTQKRYLYPLGRKEADMLQGDFDVKDLSTGEILELVPTDENAAIHPNSIYGLTKYYQEQALLITCQSIGIPAVAFRYQNVYGPGQSLKNPYTGILSIFSTRIKAHKPINIFEDGKESRDFVYIDDVVRATILGIEKDTANYQVINVGAGVSTSVLEVVSELMKNYGITVPFEISGQFRNGDIRHNLADMTKAESLLGFKASIPFAEGIKHFTDWVNTQSLTTNYYEQSLQELKEKGLLK